MSRSFLRLCFVIVMLVLSTPPLAVTTAPAALHACRLNAAGADIQHVIYVQFDNVHFRRDNPNVPSDLEQMPHLLNFITGAGTLMANDHTVLISHTATGFLSSITGVYPDRMGQPISNSFRYFTPTGASRTGVSFAYWTAPLFDPAPGQTDFTPEMINENGKIAPAPWVPFTRAGCDFGSVAMANTILENTAIDIPTVFGSGSPEAAEVASNPGQAFADFVGIGIHCARFSPRCTPAHHGRPDLLPDEPGGYTGFMGLFGAKYVDALISPGGPLRDLDGNIIQDAAGHVGFPGFDGTEPAVTLAWVAAMQEHGIPVTYAYMSDAHDNHGTAGNLHFAYAPGEAGYVAQLRAYDQAFAKFFERLAADGITEENTLFVFTVDEGDHFIGGAPTPAGCDGITTPCTYDRVGEISANLRGLIATQFGITTPFTVHADSGPTVYVTGNPPRTSSLVRDLERASARLTATNPYTNAVDHVTAALADPVEERTLHMVTADPFRTPTFTLFGDPNYFFFAGAPNCSSPCVTIPPRGPNSFAWNHGDIQDEIASTWAGYVGPGVRQMGTSDDVWTDHTDLRPTMLALLGLHDDYAHDGRVVVELLLDRAVPRTLRAHRETLLRLGGLYKQLNAAFGAFAMDTLAASTRALAADDAGDATFTSIENQIQSLTDQRNALAAQMKTLLDAAAFESQSINEQQATQLIAQGQEVLEQAHKLAFP